MTADTNDMVLIDRVPRQVRGSTTAIDAAQLEPLTNVNGIPAEFASLFHVQVSTGGFDARAHEASRGAAAQLTEFETTNHDEASGLGFPVVALPATVDDEAMVLASEDLIRSGINREPGMHAYVAQPRVFVNAGGASASSGQLWILTDLMTDGVSIVVDGNLAARDAAVRQIWYGTLETALETQLMQERATKVFSQLQSQLGTSLAMDKALTVIDPQSASTLPATARPELAREVRQGSIVLVPGDVGTANVWWTVDPVTGATRSIVDPGYGGELASGMAVELPPPDAPIGRRD